MLSGLREILGGWLEWIYSLLVSLVSGVFDFFVSWIPDGAKTVMSSEFDAPFSTAHTSGVLGAVANAWPLVSWFYPARETLAYLVLVMGTVGAIRVVRWVVALIPTWIVGG